MKKKIIIILSLVFGITLCCEVDAQNIVEEPMITNMMNNYAYYNRQNTKMRGWRVQILSTTNRRDMESTRRRFEGTYPGYHLRFKHDEPFFRLQTGAFANRQTARPFLKQLQKKFPGAILVTDEMEVSEMLSYH